MNRLQQALAAFVAATNELEDAWTESAAADDRDLAEGYPAYLPSFDDVAADVREWARGHKITPSVFSSLTPATMARVQTFCVGVAPTDSPDYLPGRLAVRYSGERWEVTATVTKIRGYGDLRTGPATGALSCDTESRSEVTSGTSSPSLDLAVNAALDGIGLAIQKWRM